MSQATLGSPRLWGDVEKSAALSPDGLYRYALERRWGLGDTVLFVMLNPSTANAELDDPTIRRCMGFARTWGFDALLVWNLYAYRATDPSELDRVDDPIGPDNQDHLWAALEQSSTVVAAWGANPNRGTYAYRERSITIALEFKHHPVCLGLTKAGHPRHPLYVRKSTPWRRWRVAGVPEDRPIRDAYKAGLR